MNKNLLIVGASTYGIVASDIAMDMGCFDKIDFVDDNRKTTPNGIDVIGTTKDIEKLVWQYSNIIVAIGNSEVRLSLIKKIEEETPYRIVSLVSPKAYVSSTAQIMKGCIIEPMAVIHTACVIHVGCIISAGAVINHASMCCEGVHIDCNATVAGYTIVPAGMKVCSGIVFKKETIEAKDLCSTPTETVRNVNTNKKPHGPIPIDGCEYCFEDGM